MDVFILEERGWSSALLGMSLAFKDPAQDILEFWNIKKFEKAQKVAKTLSKKGLGHNKFLESMVVWAYVKAPRYWWSEFDTYRVGMTKQSESTMHTLTKRKLTQEDFGTKIPEDYLKIINDKIEQKDLKGAKKLLPESFLQGRVICTNYKCLQNIILQRQNHRLPEWQEFVKSLKYSLKHYEYIGEIDEEETETEKSSS